MLHIKLKRPILFACLFLSLSVVFTAYHKPFNSLSPKEQASKHFHIADRAYGKGKIKKALTHLKKAIELDGKEKKYILYIAKIYHKLGRYDSAIKWINQMRKIIEDEDPFLAIKLMNWVGGYAISLDKNKQAIKLFEGAVDKMNMFGFQDSLFLTSLYNNWGVAELFDQGDIYPCDEQFLGNCGKIHISDVKRARKRFLQANEYAPDNCNRMARWNQTLMDKILMIPEDTLTKYKSYIPVSWIDQIVIEKQDTICPLSIGGDTIQTKVEVKSSVLDYFNDYDELVFVLDISGSMSSRVAPDNEMTRFNLMKKTIINRIEKADSTQKIGLITVGGDCNRSPFVRIPAEIGNRGALTSYIKRMSPDGGTPLYESLNNSLALFSNEENKKLIFLASDGIESCETNFSVCNLATEICEVGIRVDVMSMLLDERSNYNAYGLYECISNVCESPVIHVNKEAKFDAMEQFIPPGYCSFWVYKKDLKSGEFKEQLSCSLSDIIKSGEQPNQSVMLKYAFTLACVFSFALPSFCQPLAEEQKDIDEKIKSLVVASIDSQVYAIYDKLEINDDLNLFELFETLDMGDVYHSVNLDSMISRIDWNEALKQVNWNEMVKGFNWQEMVDSMCIKGPGGEPDLPNTDKAPSDVMQDMDMSKVMKCMGGDMMQMMDAMDQMCMMQKLMQGKIKLSPDPKDIEGFCEMAECINFEKYFAGVDWDCFYKNIDLNSVFGKIDFKDLIESMKTYKVGGGDSLMFKDYTMDHPMLKGIDFEQMKEQMTGGAGIVLSDSAFTKVYQNLYNNIIENGLLTKEDKDDLKKITLLSFSMMNYVFPESRELKYYITHLWLLFDAAEKIRQFRFSEALSLLDLQENLILVAMKDAIFDSRALANEYGNVRVILGPSYELKSLIGLYQEKSTVHAQFGQYTASRDALESAIKLRQTLIDTLSGSDSAKPLLEFAFSSQVREILSSRYGITSETIELSTTDLLYGRDPAVVKKLLDYHEFGKADTVYQIIKDNILIKSRNNDILPGFIVQNKLIDRAYALKMLKNIYRRRAVILDLAGRPDSSEWKMCFDGPNTLEKLQQRQWLALSYAQLGEVDLLTGNYEFALENLEKAWKRLKTVENLDYVNIAYPGVEISEKEFLNKMPFFVSVAQNLAILRVNRQEYDLALKILQEAQEVLADKERFIGVKKDSPDYKKNLFNIYGTLGDVQLQMNDTLAAAKQYQTCKELSDAAGSEILSMRYHMHQGGYLLRQEKYELAMQEFKSAESFAQKTGYEYGEALAKSRIGAIYQKLGQPEKAIQNYEEVVQIAKALNQYLLLVEIYTLRGILAQKAGQVKEAQAWYDEGINVMEGGYFNYFQGSVSRQLALEKANDCYAGAIGTALELGNADRAFQYIQQTKARTLNELLIEGELQRSTGLSDTLKQLKAEKQNILYELNSSYNSNTTSSDEANSDNLRELKLDELEIINAKIRQEITGKNGEKLSFDTPSIEAIQKQLRKDEAIVEYFVGQSIYAFIINKNSFEVINLENGQQALQQIEEFVDEVDFTIKRLRKHEKPVMQLSILKKSGTRDLYDSFWQPVQQSELLKTVNSLTIIPDASLYLIPFEALIDTATNNYLLDHYQISYFPSMATWYQYSKTPSQRPSFDKELLVISKSEFENYDDFEPINQEALNAIFENKGEIDFLLEEQTNLDTLMNRDLTTYRYLYFSTHGFVKSPPELSFLPLHNSQLSLYQTFDLQLNNEVVVLSACETAKGEFKRGAGLMGFTRGLLYAGAHSIVISLWQVEEQATEKLMEFFFQALKKGDTPRIALSKAKQQLREWDKRQYDNPFYWGAFVVFGKA